MTYLYKTFSQTAFKTCHQKTCFMSHFHFQFQNPKLMFGSEKNWGKENNEKNGRKEKINSKSTNYFSNSFNLFSSII